MKNLPELCQACQRCLKLCCPNMVLLGALSGFLNLPMKAWLESMKSAGREEDRSLNWLAFQLGRSMNSGPNHLQKLIRGRGQKIWPTLIPGFINLAGNISL